MASDSHTPEETRDDGTASPLGSPEILWRAVRRLSPFAIVCLGVLAILYTLYFAQDLFLPVFFAVFLSILLKPLVRSLAATGLPKVLAAIIVLLGLVGSIIAGAINLAGPAEDWFDRLPTIQRQIEAKLWPVRRSIEKAQETTEKIRNIADGDTSRRKQQEVTVKGESLLARAFQTTWLSLVQVVITIALTFLFLIHTKARTKERYRRFPWRQYQIYVDDFFETAQEKIGRFVRISAVIYLCLGILTALAMYLLGMPNPLLWGALAFLLGFMPYVGPLLVAASIGLASLLTFDTWWQIAAPPFAYIAMTTIEGYFLTPAILGRQLTLSPIAVFLSMLLWTWLWGMPGAFLSVPIVVIATLFVRHLLLVMGQKDTGEVVASPPQATIEQPSG